VPSVTELQELNVLASDDNADNDTAVEPHFNGKPFMLYTK